jgi:hypothetical protein
MKALFGGSSPWLSALMLLGVLMNGCATGKIDWTKRIGIYTYDQTILELGPPDKQAKLADGTIVADWLATRGYYYSSPPIYGYYPYGGPYYAYTDAYRTPDSFLRLTFGADGKLHAWKRVYK